MQLALLLQTLSAGARRANRFSQLGNGRSVSAHWSVFPTRPRPLPTFRSRGARAEHFAVGSARLRQPSFSGSRARHLGARHGVFAPRLARGRVSCAGTNIELCHKRSVACGGAVNILGVVLALRPNYSFNATVMCRYENLAPGAAR